MLLADRSSSTRDPQMGLNKQKLIWEHKTQKANDSCLIQRGSKYNFSVSYVVSK